MIKGKNIFTYHLLELDMKISTTYLLIHFLQLGEHEVNTNEQVHELDQLSYDQQIFQSCNVTNESIIFNLCKCLIKSAI